jgi:hypothetical protein
MARYTYKQFEDAAKKEGLYEQFGAADLAEARNDPDFGMSILGAKVGYRDAQTDEDREKWRQSAEDSRRSKGYTTTDGGNYAIQLPVEQYDQRINSLLNSIENRQFSYDANSDPNMAAYRKAAIREGRRATQDTMSQAAMMTGGKLSSAAVTAGAQQNNYYASQIADKYPELYQQAYNRWVQQLSNDAQSANLLMQQRSAQWNQAEQAFQHGDTSKLTSLGVNMNNDPTIRQRQIEQAQLAYQYGDDSYLRKVGIDTSNDLNRKAQEQQIQSQEWQQQLQRAQAAAALGDYSMLQQMGFNTSRADFDQKLQIAQILLQYTGDSSELRKLLSM